MTLLLPPSYGQVSWRPQRATAASSREQVCPQVYRRYRAAIKEPVLLARGAVSRRDGTMNVVVSQVEALKGVGQLPKSRDWG